MGQRLGQHFLISKVRAREIIEALDLKSGDFVVEIGSGHGELTYDLGLRIKEIGGRLVAIEKDRALAEELAWKFEIRSTKSETNSPPKADQPSAEKLEIPSFAKASAGRQKSKMTIIEGDVLKVLPKLTDNLQLITDNYKLVGNIPYYITGKLLRIIGDLEHKPEVTVLTIQKEVAERLTAKPPKMNLLAACVQVWADVDIVGHISRKEFRPIPDVDSAIVRLKVKSYKLKENQILSYYELTRVLFKQPRKTIINNLMSNNEFLISNKAPKTKDEIVKILQDIGINSGDRPQDLGVEDIARIAAEIMTN